MARIRSDNEVLTSGEVMEVLKGFLIAALVTPIPSMLLAERHVVTTTEDLAALAATMGKRL